MADKKEFRNKDGIVIHTDEKDFEGMRKAGRLAAECLDYITPFVEVGVTTEYLDDLCRKFIQSHGAIPACLGYHGQFRLVWDITDTPKAPVFPSIMKFVTEFLLPKENFLTVIC